MSDSEEDYMSDKLFAQESVDIRPGLIKLKTQERKHQLYKQELVQRAKKPKTSKELEENLRNEGLQKAISSENKGFKMLEKMGFKAGSSLGKSDSGIKEPINISLKKNAGGVGRENFIKEVRDTKEIIKSQILQVTEQEFKAGIAERNSFRVMQKDFRKAQVICQELDLRNNVAEPKEVFYWTREGIELLKTKKKKNESSDEDSEDSEEEGEDYLNHINLHSIIDYIRITYLYCIYCVFTASDQEDLMANCPGSYRECHDDVD